MLKIVYIHHSTGIGGAPISLVEMIKALPKDEITAEVLLLKRSSVCSLLEKAGIKYRVVDNWFYNNLYIPYAHIEVGWARLSDPIKFTYYTLSWLISRFIVSPAIFRDIEADVVHLNSYALVDLLHAAMRVGQTVLHVREPVTRGHFGVRFAILRRQIEKYASHVIAISKDNATRLCLTDVPVSVIYNFYDPGSINYPLASTVKPSVIYVGGDAPHKGIFSLLKALPFIDRGIEVKVCGNFADIGRGKNQKWPVGSRFPRLRRGGRRKAVIGELCSHPNVTFIGLSENVALHIASSSLLLNLFTITHFSRPIIEAYFLGRGVIATDVDGIREIVEDNLTGSIVPVSDPIALAKAINHIALDPEYLDKIGKNALLKASATFSIANIGSVMAVYRSLLTLPSPTLPGDHRSETI